MTLKRKTLLATASKVFLFFSLLSFNFAQAAQISQAESDVLAQKLYADPVWLSLLQIHPPDSKEIVDPQFYVSMRRQGPKQELLDFIRQLYSEAGAQTACRFPARYFWLQNKVPIITHDLQKCAELQEFRSRAPVEKLSLIFASENLSQPSSMMGHVFFKIEGRNSAGIEVGHMISFFTDLGDLNVPKLILESLVTGKKGLYTLAPYEANKNYYLFVENRNIWEYGIKLSVYQQQLIAYYIFELKNITFDYYFHVFNCATLVRNILAVAYPQVASKFQLWATPLDVVREIDQAQIISDRSVIPSTRWKLRAFQENFNLSDTNLARIRTRNFDKLETKGLTKNEMIFTNELARAFNDFQLEEQEIAKDEWSRANRELLRTRNEWMETAELDFTDYKQPTKTPPDSQMAVGGRSYLNENSYRLRFLPASHSLEDDNSQYQNESELKMGELGVSYSPSENRFDIESFIAYSAIALQPHDRFYGGLSGMLRFGVMPKLNNDLHYDRTAFIDAGLGQTFRTWRDFDFYYLIALGARSNTEPSLSVSPQAGIILREVFNLKSIIQVSESFQYREGPLQEFSFLQTWNNTVLPLTFKCNFFKLAETQSEYEISAKYLF